MSASAGLRDYLVVTGNYWAFTLTDGAIRMLVVLHFHQLGYQPLEIALLFLLYEFFGVLTNLVGGWVGARLGLNLTMQAGTTLQVLALGMLAVDARLLTVPYVMLAQALSGIAKDLNKMSAKASVKLMAGDRSGRLFHWVALLTGSKNTLKGGGYFLGGLLLALLGFRSALLLLAGALALSLAMTLVLLPRDMGRSRAKPKFTRIFSNSRAINWLSAARFFLFGSRDVWFVIALPVFLSEQAGWSHTKVGAFLALWIIGYGLVQAIAPRLLRRNPDGSTVLRWGVGLAAIPGAMALALTGNVPAVWVVVGGLVLFAVVFAINSAAHSYLILAYSDSDKVALSVGFYYMSNAGGRLLGTVAGGWLFQLHGLSGCLWLSVALLIAAVLFTLPLPRATRAAG